MRKKFVKRSLALALAFTIAFGETGYVLAEEPAQTVEFDISDGDAGEPGAPADVSGGDGTEVPGEDAGKPGENEDVSAGDVSGNVPEDSDELEEMFPGLTEEYALTATEMDDKTILGNYAQEWGGAEEGVDYAESEILVEAETEEEANAYAQAFNGTLTDYFFGVAVITLNADESLPEASVKDAVYASSLEEMALPAAWPNYYRYIEDVDAEEIVEEQTYDFAAAEEVESGGQEEEGFLGTDGYNDPFLTTTNGGYQWQHSVLNSQLAWAAGYRGQKVKVAVLDTGILAGHDDVSAVKTIDVGYGTADGHGHGTHVSGIIGAKLNNGTGGAGVAPECYIYSIKVLKDTGSGASSTIIKGVNQAVDNKVDIINMSLGGALYSQVEADAYQRAYEAGIAVFCAAGNEFSNSAHYPAAYKSTISVAALDKSMGKAYFSNYDSGVRYSAPGVDIFSTYKDSKTSYKSMSGTSQATPVTAGAAAVIWATLPSNLSGKAKVDALLKKMDSSCSKVTGKGLGKGCIDLAKALGLTNNEAAPKKPEFVTKPGTFTSTSIRVAIKSPDPGCIIYYSTDGKPVTYKNGVLSDNALEYSDINGGIAIGNKANVTVYAIAMKRSNRLVSPVVCGRFTFKPKVSSLTVTSTNGISTLAQGTSLTLKATCAPDYAPDKKVIWSLERYSNNTASDNDPKVTGVSINASGKITASKTAAIGNYRVTAKMANSNVYTTFTFTVCAAPKNPVTSITAKNKNVTVNVGEAFTVQAADVTVTRKDKTKTNAAALFWIPEDNSVVSVITRNGNIVITGKKAGKTKVIGIAGDGSGKTVAITVNVKQKPQAVTSVTITGSGNVMCVRQGKSVKLTANVFPSTAANKKVNWSYSPAREGITVVNGVVKAAKNAKPCNITVTATAADGSGASANYVISIIEEEKNTTLTVDKKSVDIFRTTNNKGAATSATVTVNCSSPYWSATSSAPGLVSVTGSGSKLTIKATGKGTGTATVTVATTDGTNKKATIKVTVKNPATNLMISPQSGRSSYVAKGTTLQLIPTFETASGKINADAKKLTWTSSNPSAVKVDNQGRVTGMSDRSYKVTITAKTNDGSNLVATYVVVSCDKVKTIKIGSSRAYSFGVGDYKGVRLYEYGASYGTVSYAVDVKSNKEGLTVGYTVSNGYPYITFAANKKGTYTVTVSCIDGSSAKATYKVVVK